MEMGLLHDFFGNFFHARRACQMRLNPCEVRLDIEINRVSQNKYISAGRRGSVDQIGWVGEWVEVLGPESGWEWG